jgi:hypothetical protein
MYENSAQTRGRGRLRAHPARMIVPPVSAFAQTEVAIFAIVKQKPGTLNTRLFQSEQNNEYLLHHRRSGRGHRGRRLFRSAPLMNESARKKLGPRGVPSAPDTARMTPQEGKNIPKSGEFDGHTA